LPIEVAAATRLPAECDGGVVTAFLSGSPERPRAELRDDRPAPGRPRRLTLSPAVRRLVGIPDGADALGSGRPCPGCPGRPVHAHVVPGRVLVGTVDDQHRLAAGDFIRCPGEIQHALAATTGPATVDLVTTVPRVQQFQER
jgi:hypothetical protein